MSTFLRYAYQPALPCPVAELPRVALAARIAVLRDVLTRLEDQAHLDGGEPFESVGRLKVELIRREGQLRQREREPNEEDRRAEVMRQAMSEGFSHHIYGLIHRRPT